VRDDKENEEEGEEEREPSLVKEEKREKLKTE
jgi:hypothetical protein